MIRRWRVDRDAGVAATQVPGKSVPSPITALASNTEAHDESSWASIICVTQLSEQCEA
jgi:hypothetical protein